ncbi:MAG: NUDIX domain-containing protein [Bdellovibrionales bacterium]
MVQGPQAFAGMALLARDAAGRLCIQIARRAEGLDDAGLWSIPAGAQNIGESAESAAIRECLEEMLGQNEADFKNEPATYFFQALGVEESNLRFAHHGTHPQGTFETYVAISNKSVEELKSLISIEDNKEYGWENDVIEFMPLDDLAFKIRQGAIKVHPNLIAALENIERAATTEHLFQRLPDGRHVLPGGHYSRHLFTTPRVAYTPDDPGLEPGDLVSSNVSVFGRSGSGDGGRGFYVSAAFTPTETFSGLFIQYLPDDQFHPFRTDDQEKVGFSPFYFYNAVFDVNPEPGGFLENNKVPPRILLERLMGIPQFAEQMNTHPGVLAMQASKDDKGFRRELDKMLLAKKIDGRLTGSSLYDSMRKKFGDKITNRLLRSVGCKGVLNGACYVAFCPEQDAVSFELDKSKSRLAPSADDVAARLHETLIEHPAKHLDAQTKKLAEMTLSPQAAAAEHAELTVHFKTVLGYMGPFLAVAGKADPVKASRLMESLASRALWGLVSPKDNDNIFRNIGLVSPELRRGAEGLKQYIDVLKRDPERKPELAALHVLLKRRALMKGANAKFAVPGADDLDLKLLQPVIDLAAKDYTEQMVDDDRLDYKRLRSKSHEMRMKADRSAEIAARKYREQESRIDLQCEMIDERIAKQRIVLPQVIFPTLYTAGSKEAVSPYFEREKQRERISTEIEDIKKHQQAVADMGATEYLTRATLRAMHQSGLIEADGTMPKPADIAVAKAAANKALAAPSALRNPPPRAGAGFTREARI